jgi:hypothetical protein
LENNLMVGSGQWIADFNESFWDYQINNLTFDFFLWGGMRPKGFALSRLAAILVLPNYKAACFAYAGGPEIKQLSAIETAINQVAEAKNIDWSWVVIAHEGAFSSQAISKVEKDDTRKLGIALVDVKNQAIVTSHSYVGRRMERFIRVFK